MPLKETGHTGRVEVHVLSQDITVTPDHRGPIAALHQGAVLTEGAAARPDREVAIVLLRLVVQPIPGLDHLLAEVRATAERAGRAILEVRVIGARVEALQGVPATEVRAEHQEVLAALEVLVGHTDLQVEVAQVAADVPEADVADNNSKFRLNKIN